MIEFVCVKSISKLIHFGVNATKNGFTDRRTSQIHFLTTGTRSESPTYHATNWVCDEMLLFSVCSEPKFKNTPQTDFLAILARSGGGSLEIPNVKKYRLM